VGEGIRVGRKDETTPCYEATAPYLENTKGDEERCGGALREISNTEESLEITRVGGTLISKL